MRFKKLDLNLLVALDNMLALKSVSAAADKMFMSQSAMSNALTRLRSYFDDPLLVQVGKRMELTPLAEAMKPKIRDVLVRIEATIDLQPDFDPTVSNRVFNVLLSDFSLQVLVPYVLAELEAMEATVNLNLLAQSEAPFLMLERGDADLLIAPEQTVSTDHPSALLFEDQHTVIACANGPYADVQMDRNQYESARHAVMRPMSTGYSIEDSLLKDAGIKRKIDLTTFSFSALPHMVAGTSRIATVHRLTAMLAAKSLSLACYKVPVELPAFRQMMQWHAYREQDLGIIWLREVFESAAVEMLADIVGE